jgi:exodeoxyribonuclease V alpha subunit
MIIIKDYKLRLMPNNTCFANGKSILPLLSGPQMLLNRNLLYTAVTRARKCVTVVGKEETFAEMIRNEKQQKRYSALDERIRELSETTGDNNTDGEE